jgi:hypothetical protein
MPPKIIRCRGKVFPELLPSNDRGIHKHTDRYKHPTILIFLRVFAAAGTCLPSRCLSMKGGGYTRILPSLCLVTIRGIHIYTQTDGRDL